MRFPRPAHLAVLLAVLIFAGAKAYRHVQQRRQSPFVLWELRAGMPFEAIEQSAFRQMKGRFTCNPVVPGARLCDLRVSGIAGLVRALVDSRDRAVAIQFLPDSASPVMREEGRRVAAEWNVVRAGVAERPDPRDSATGVTRWRSEDGKWSARMRYGRFAATPDVLHLADESGLAGVLASTPLAPFVLALNQFVESRDVGDLDDVSEVLRTTLFSRATDPANESPAPTAPSASLPFCVSELADPIVPGDGRIRTELTEPVATLLEAAIPAVYPGTRLVFGDGTWIVDSAGRSERVHLGRADVAGDEQAFVFAVEFPGRSAVAAQRLEDGVTDRYCRAPAELLFARGNHDGSLAGAHLVVVDQDAMASAISTIRLAPPSVVGDPAHIRVRHSASFAGDAWLGTIEWETVIAGVPPRATARVPLTFAHRPRDLDVTKDGYLVVTARPAGGIELSTLERNDWGYSTRKFVVPLDASGVLLGARVLDRQW